MIDTSIHDKLNNVFAAACASFHDDDFMIGQLWQEIRDEYGSEHRHYHTLEHLDTMYSVLQEVSSSIADMQLTLFALFYHDIVYRPLRSDNEKCSADLAVNRLRRLGLTSSSLTWVRQAIESTKEHQAHRDSDINSFLDGDLPILGFSPQNYGDYTRAIRKEFAVIPDLVYKPGRKEVLQRFLDMPSIFKTVPFQVKFEQQARINIQEELKMLG